MADTKQGYSVRKTYILHMNNDYCISNHRSIVHQVRDLGIYRDPSQSTYLTIGWRRRECMSITTGRKWEMRYMYIYIQSQEQGKPRESMATA